MTTGRVFCPDPHTYGPATGDAWREWAVEMRRTHDLHQCPDCGLAVIWRPRTQPEEPPGLFDDRTNPP